MAGECINIWGTQAALFLSALPSSPAELLPVFTNFLASAELGGLLVEIGCNYTRGSCRGSSLESSLRKVCWILECSIQVSCVQDSDDCCCCNPLRIMAKACLAWEIAFNAVHFWANTERTVPRSSYRVKSVLLLLLRVSGVTHDPLRPIPVIQQ